MKQLFEIVIFLSFEFTVPFLQNAPHYNFILGSRLRVAFSPINLRVQEFVTDPHNKFSTVLTTTESHAIINTAIFGKKNRKNKLPRSVAGT